MKKPEKHLFIGNDKNFDITHVYAYRAEEMDAYIAHLETQVERLSFAVSEAREVIASHSSWFSRLSDYQEPLLSNGLDEACKNWSKASDPNEWPSDLQSLNFDKLKEWLSKYGGGDESAREVGRD